MPKERSAFVAESSKCFRSGVVASSATDKSHLFVGGVSLIFFRTETFFSSNVEFDELPLSSSEVDESLDDVEVDDDDDELLLVLDVVDDESLDVDDVVEVDDENEDTDSLSLSAFVSSFSATDIFMNSGFMRLVGEYTGLNSTFGVDSTSDSCKRSFGLSSVLFRSTSASNADCPFGVSSLNDEFTFSHFGEIGIKLGGDTGFSSESGVVEAPNAPTLWTASSGGVVLLSSFIFSFVSLLSPREGPTHNINSSYSS